MGMVTQPYQDIADCVRAALCVSHSLRQTVRVTICFDEIGPLSLHLNPQTIRFMGTDERSILQILLRAQEASRAPKKTRLMPVGVQDSQLTAQNTVAEALDSRAILLLPGPQATWQQHAASPLVMYCSLSESRQKTWFSQFPSQSYQEAHKPDLAILRVLHTLDDMIEVGQKD
jgi:hypothetical protein